MTEARPLVSVIVVTWNSAPYLRRCLDGLARQTHQNRELIVVDNASIDDSLNTAGAGAAYVIPNESNRGFSVAVNQGLAVSRGEFVLLLNPDCHLEDNYIELLISAMRLAGERFGMATGKLMRGQGHDIAPTRVIDSKGIRMTRSGRHFDIDQGKIDDEDAADYEVFGVSGAAAMYRMSMLRDVAIEGEIFDEDFFVYREDADLSWRARLFGWRAIYVSDAVAQHVRHVTPEKRRQLSASINMHSVKNRFLLRLKNEGLYLAFRNAVFEIPRDVMVILAALTIERSSAPAIAWLWRNRAKVRAKRAAIQSRRVVADRALAGWFR